MSPKLRIYFAMVCVAMGVDNRHDYWWTAPMFFIFALILIPDLSDE